MIFPAGVFLSRSAGTPTLQEAQKALSAMEGRRPRRPLLRCASLVVCLAFGCSALGITESDVYQVLDERGIAFDTQAVHRAAAEAVLREVDPHGRLLGPDNETPQQFVTVESVREWQDGIGYLELGGMHGGGDNAVAHLEQWNTNGPFSVVIDLRGAGGHDLATVDEIAGALVVSNVLLYSVVDAGGTTSETHHVESVADVASRPRPVMLLIDEHTRDASELLAAVLQGREGIMLLGSATHGDARIRREIALTGDENAFLATGRAIPFGGRAYDRVGVQPDITVDCDTGDAVDAGPDKTRLGEPLTDRARLDRERTLRIGGDPALTRAVDILIGLKALQVRGQ